MITTSSLGEVPGSSAAAPMPAMPKRADKTPEMPSKPEIALGLVVAETVTVSHESRLLASNGSGSDSSKPSVTEEVSQRIRQMVQTIEKRATSLEFQIEQDTHRIIVRVINRATGEVIRQIPPEELLRLSGGTKDLRGLLLNEAS